MDFNKLYRQIQAIDEGRECEVEECGMAMSPMSIDKSQSQQPDNVSMNVNMNASGSGGIKDLIDILKNIERADEPDSGIKLFGRDKDDGQTIMIGDEYDNVDEYANTSDPTEYSIDRMIASGNDLHASDSGQYPRLAATVSGSNPLAESLVSRLSDLYMEIKNR